MALPRTAADLSPLPGGRRLWRRRSRPWGVEGRVRASVFAAVAACAVCANALHLPFAVTQGPKGLGRVLWSPIGVAHARAAVRGRMERERLLVPGDLLEDDDRGGGGKGGRALATRGQASCLPDVPAVAAVEGTLSKAVQWPTNDEEEEYVPQKVLAMPGSDADTAMSRGTTQHYLESLTRYTDDGIPLLQAADRYDSNDWFYILISTHKSRVLRRISSHLMFSVTWACIVSATHRFTNLFTPLSPMLHGLIGGTLGICLAFRLNQSYDRFWEARGLWTQVGGNACNLAQLVTTAVSEIGGDRERILATLRCLAAYPVALKQYLRGQRRLEEFRGILSTEEVDMLKSTDNWPLVLTQRLYQTVAPFRITEPNAYWLLTTPLREMTLIIGRCERLVRTPVPLSYVRHTSRFLSLFTLTLPLVLVGHVSSMVVPLAVGVVSWALFSIEEIGHLIEEPFGASVATATAAETAELRPQPRRPVGGRRQGVLPLDRYCDGIRKDIMEILGQVGHLLVKDTTAVEEPADASEPEAATLAPEFVHPKMQPYPMPVVSFSH